MKLVGGNPQAHASGAEKLAGTVNYLRGNDPKKWRAGVPLFAKVRYASVYPGTDLVYYGREGKLEYDFIVKPGADPNKIRLRFGGAEGMEVAGNGDLVLRTNGGDVRQQKPFVYQEVGGKRREVDGRFLLASAAGDVGFQVGRYDRSLPLVIDPAYIYSTYLGGNNIDGATGVAKDARGSAYVVGSTLSTNFPTASPAQADQGGQDVFVTKFNAAGSALLFSTYLGGSDADTGTAIAVDKGGNAYVTGFTMSNNFPTVSPVQGYQGMEDIFVTKLRANGSGPVYSTYVGGTGSEEAYGIAVDGKGSAYVTGGTNSTDYPTVTPFQADQPGVDAVLTKLKPTGNAYTYSTYLGGSGFDLAYGIAVDSKSNPYVTGYTDSTNFPTVTPIQGHQGVEDAFVTKFKPQGTALAYSTYLGGSGSDVGRGIGLDSKNNAYVTGFTNSTNFPASHAFQVDQPGTDAFVTRISARGTAIVYSTYLGGVGSDLGFGIAVDRNGNAYVTGQTASIDFPLFNAFQGYRGMSDAFVTKVKSNGTLLYSTLLGGADDEIGTGVAADSAGNAYAVGSTNSTNFVTFRPFQADQSGQDAYVVKISK
jgi:hypothetical protein